ncbi:Trk system potassium uptake protein TrkA [Lachnospiraceae bacterium TWA4]|nr:Trk system potassium uptake protein TrkA [Lachnospiraceae bacterium TWA4]
MKIIIAGNGKVGSLLIKQLSAANYDITVIDTKKSILETSVENYDVMAICGNCATMSTLDDAGIKNADLLIAVTNADEINLLCCMTAYGMNPHLHTIARIRNPEYSDQIYRMRELFGLSLVVNPERDAAREIEHLLKYPGFLKREGFAKGRIEIVELKVDATSKLCNVTLNDLYGIIKCQILVCAVLRDGKAIMPDGSFTMREGDRIFVTAPSDRLTILLKNLGIITRKVKNVILCGGGRISYYLAQKLEKCGINALLIEKNPQKCEQLAEMLPDTCIINGDASNLSFLEGEGLLDSDAIVNLTGLDELNIIISLYANKCGVSQVITKLGHMENSELIDNLSIGSVVSPKELCSNTIVQYVRAIYNQTGAATAIHTIADGQAEAIEFIVDSKTKHCGEPLKNLRTKQNVLIACISHGLNIEIPNGNSSFKEGDMVIIISNGNDVIYQLNDIFED